MAECTHVFAPCHDPNCERPCGKRSIPLIVIVDAPVSRFFERVLVVAIIVTALIGGVVGHGSLTRQESRYQATRT